MSPYVHENGVTFADDDGALVAVDDDERAPDTMRSPPPIEETNEPA